MHACLSACPAMLTPRQHRKLPLAAACCPDSLMCHILGTADSRSRRRDPCLQCVQRIPALTNWLVVAIDEQLRDYCVEVGCCMSRGCCCRAIAC